MGASIMPMIGAPQSGMPATNKQYGPIATSTFGPDQNLVGTMFTPGMSSGTTAALGDVNSGLASLQSAPDRGALASQTFQQLTDASAPQYQQDMRAVGQNAAKYGRIGSGVTTSELGDVALQRQKYLGNLGAQLATQSAGQTMQDRLSKLGAGQSVLGQLGGMDQQQYQNLTGERGYQNDLSQQAFNNNLAQTGQLANYGGLGGDTNAGISNIADNYAQQGAGNMAGGSNLLQLLLQNGGIPGLGASGKYDTGKTY